MRVGSVLLVAWALTGCALSGAPISPYGRSATLYGERDRVSGELIALTPDTVWLLSDTTLRAVHVPSLRSVRVARHTFGLRRTMRWMGFAGLGTGAALLISCNSYESSSDGSGDNAECLAVLPVTFLVFAAGGLLFGSINEYTANHHLSPADTARIRGFSRYPQGLPDSLRRLPYLPRSRWR